MAAKQPDYMKWLPPKTTATISRCELFGRTMKSGFISGRHRSPKKGNSVEFAEHRQYMPGDDLRTLDWKVLGRKGRLYIRQYEEESNLRAGILCLELCGSHEDPDSMEASKFLMSVYKEKMLEQSFMYYGVYYASQGLFQLGGQNWKEYEDWMYSTFLPRQKEDGSWPQYANENMPVYSTAMTILAFSVPYRQLPVYQRDETVDE